MADIVHILAANLNREMDRRKDAGLEYGTNESLAQKVGVSSNSIGRMRRGESSIGIILLADVAKALGLSPWELLFPGLDATSRPEIVADHNERALLAVHRRKPGDTKH